MLAPISAPISQPSSAPRASSHATPRLTAIASGKGGVGKTWFAITLSHALAQLGRRVLLFDGDFGLANIDIQLGLPPAPGLGAVVAGRLPWSDAAQILPLGFAVLAGQSGSGALAGLAAQEIPGIAADLRTLPYHEIVLDLGAGLDASTRALAAQASRLLVVATDEPTSLTDAYAVIKLHGADAPAADIRIVINQAASPTSGQRTYATLARACAQFLHRTPALAGIIRRDDKVRDAIRHQTALLTRHPSCPAAEDVARIAATLLTTPHAPASNLSSPSGPQTGLDRPRGQVP